MEANPKPTVKINDRDIISFLSTKFIFKKDEGKAGQVVPAQLSITSNAQPGSAPIVLSRLQVKFTGNIKPLVLEHQEDVAQERHGNIIISSAPLQESAEESDMAPEKSGRASALQGAANLTLLPGCSLIIDLEIPLREAGEAEANSAIFFISLDAFNIEYEASSLESSPADVYHLSVATRKRISRARPHALRVLPRPPKMEIKPMALKEEYYTNEPINLQLGLLNAEDEAASGKIEVILSGEEPPSFRLKINGSDIAGVSGE